jgi:hypothetical protein
MPVNPAANARSGGSQLLNFAKTMCRLVNAAAPAIRLRYPDRTALLAVLTAAEGVCELLPAAMQEAYEADVANNPAFDPADGVLIPGQKP